MSELDATIAFNVNGLRKIRFLVKFLTIFTCSIFNGYCRTFSSKEKEDKFAYFAVILFYIIRITCTDFIIL